MCVLQYTKVKILWGEGDCREAGAHQNQQQERLADAGVFRRRWHPRVDQGKLWAQSCRTGQQPTTTKQVENFE